MALPSVTAALLFACAMPGLAAAPVLAGPAAGQTPVTDATSAPAGTEAADAARQRGIELGMDELLPVSSEDIRRFMKRREADSHFRQRNAIDLHLKLPVESGTRVERMTAKSRRRRVAAPCPPPGAPDVSQAPARTAGAGRGFSGERRGQRGARCPCS